MPIRAVAVFCGSKSGTNEQYQHDAETLGKLLGQQHIEMIYGGARNGLMGIVAGAAMQSGGTVRGIIPHRLANRESSHDAISELRVVDGMHERKRLMYELCDAAIILPGGFGTLDEFFEILTWNGLALHDKQVFLLNSGGFYNHLLQHLQRLSGEGFLYSSLESTFTLLKDAADFKNHLG